MTEELLYTSAPGGLKPGSAGFCVVMASKRLPSVVADQLERLSGYRHLAMPGTPEAALNPVGWSHIRLTVGSKSYAVLARIADAGLDYTNRSNMIAHYLLLDDNLPAGGPAHAIGQPGVMETSWDGPPRRIDSGRPLPGGNRAPAPCRAWAQATGDAGWAGVLAKTVLDSKKPTVYLVYEPGTNVLALFDEAIALLPPPRRWQATFNTFTQKLANNVECQWRAVVAGSPEDVQSQRQQGAVRIDLARPQPPASGPEAEAARAGQQLVVAAKPVAAPPPPVDAAPKSVARPLSLDTTTNATPEQSAVHKPQPAETDTYSLAQQPAPTRNPPPPGQAAIDWRGEDVGGAGNSKWIGLAVGLVIAVGIGIGAWATFGGGEEIADFEPDRSSRSSRPVVASKTSPPTTPEVSRGKPTSDSPSSIDSTQSENTAASPVATNTTKDSEKPAEMANRSSQNDPAGTPSQAKPIRTMIPSAEPTAVAKSSFEPSESFVEAITRTAVMEIPGRFDAGASAYFACPTKSFEGVSRDKQPLVRYSAKAGGFLFKIEDGFSDQLLTLHRKGRTLDFSNNARAGLWQRGLWCGLVIASRDEGIHLVRMVEPLELQDLSSKLRNERGKIRFEVPSIQTVASGTTNDMEHLGLRMTPLECKIPGAEREQKVRFSPSDDALSGLALTQFYSPEIRNIWRKLIVEIAPEAAVPSAHEIRLEFETQPANPELQLEAGALQVAITLRRKPAQNLLDQTVKTAVSRITGDAEVPSGEVVLRDLQVQKGEMITSIEQLTAAGDRIGVVNEISSVRESAISEIRNLKWKKPQAKAATEKYFNDLESRSREIAKAATEADDFLSSLSEIEITRGRIYYEVKLSDPLKMSVQEEFTDVTTEFDLVRIGDWSAERRDMAQNLIDQLRGRNVDSAN